MRVGEVRYTFYGAGQAAEMAVSLDAGMVALGPCGIQMVRAAEGVQHLADAHRFGIGQMEGVAIELRLVRDVVHRISHEIHRHDVDAAALDAEHRHPLRQQLAQLLDEGEEVVRPVDLVDLAGLRVTDHHARAVDAPLDAPLVASQHSGL